MDVITIWHSTPAAPPGSQTNSSLTWQVFFVGGGCPQTLPLSILISEDRQTDWFAWCGALGHRLALFTLHLARQVVVSVRCCNVQWIPSVAFVRLMNRVVDIQLQQCFFDNLDPAPPSHPLPPTTHHLPLWWMWFNGWRCAFRAQSWSQQQQQQGTSARKTGFVLLRERAACFYFDLGQWFSSSESRKRGLRKAGEAGRRQEGGGEEDE